MKNYVGIDLGTTNSAVCSYDGEETRIWKSPEQNDVTPSAIYLDKRGNKYLGKRAYDSAPQSPDNSALLFKRLMGTSTPVNFSAVDVTMTPEECSSEILKVLYGYLPEDIRQDQETGTVVTVPAAFNQMQKEATKQAAEMAGLGNIALMQEPVAAVMSVMRSRDADGIFVIYDFGGGTLDVAIAESLNRRVNLLAHGGIAMCGGRDFDRMIVDNVVKPWLHDQFDLPEDLSTSDQYRTLMRLASWASEKAKIELSSRESTVISLSEMEARSNDSSGNEIYLDIPFEREMLDGLISNKIMDSIDATRETLSVAGLSPHDVERVVFIGGPTNYKPLRDKVSFELSLPASADINPMTAVAEGAALFAESIDWGSTDRGRKSNKGQTSSQGKLSVTLNYIARTPGKNAKLAVKVQSGNPEGAEFQVDSMDTGWTSGRMPLTQGASVDLTLAKHGENYFKAFLFDSNGGPIPLGDDKIVITRTAATVDAIPASHSIGIEVLTKMGGQPVLDWLVRAGDPLPKQDKKVFKAGESLKAGGEGSIKLKIWEGEINDPITDNRYIGMLKITGNDFDDGVIPAGDNLECKYEINDSGNIVLEVTVSSIGAMFHSGRNFYSRQEGQIDFTGAEKIVVEEADRTRESIDEISEVVNDPKLDRARSKVESASELEDAKSDTEDAQEAMEGVLEARKLLAQVRKDHLKEIRQLELDNVIDAFNDFIREHARSSEQSSFDNLAKTAQKEIDRNGREFENHLSEMRGKNFEILWRQDWFVVDKFRSMASSPHSFADQQQHKELCELGMQHLQADEVDNLRGVVVELYSIMIRSGPIGDMFDSANIIKG